MTGAPLQRGWVLPSRSPEGNFGRALSQNFLAENQDPLRLGLDPIKIIAIGWATAHLQGYAGPRFKHLSCWITVGH